MAAQIVRLARTAAANTDATEQRKSLIFAFGLAHFVDDHPSVVTRLCKQGFGVKHAPSGRDRCAVERMFHEQGVKLQELSASKQTILMPVEVCMNWNSYYSA